MKNPRARTKHRPTCLRLKNENGSIPLCNKQLLGSGQGNFGHRGQAKTGGTQSVGRTPRGRGKQREPGRGHDDKERPAIIVGVSRPGGVVLQATRAFTVKTVPKAAALARPAGRPLSTDSARSSRLSTGEAHDAVHHTQQEDARGEGHENRAEGLLAWLQAYVRGCRGIRQTPLPGDGGFLQFLRHCHQLTAFEQAEMILYAALDPAVARRAKKGECVMCWDHFELLQSAIN